MKNIIDLTKYYEINDHSVVDAVIKSGQLKQMLRKAIIENILSTSDSKLSSQEEEELVNKWREKNSLTDENAYEKFMKLEGYSVQSLKEIITYPKKLEKYLESRWGQRVNRHLKRKEQYN